MQIQQFNDAFTTTLDLAAGLLVPSALSYGGGLLYGTFCNVDKILAARLFTISTIVYYTFQALAHFGTKGEKVNPKAFYATQILGMDAQGALMILAYRRLNIIGTIGTTFISTLMLFGTLTYLGKLVQAHNKSS